MSGFNQFKTTIPEDAFRRHPEFTFALSAPIYFV